MRIRGRYRITTFQIIALGFVLMILIGTMMYREPLMRYFDMTVYMRVDYREAEHRASLLDARRRG